MTEFPEPSGVAPPDMPLFPPCGTIATPCLVHSLTSAATSAVDAGDAIASAEPEYRPRQSVSQGSMSPRFEVNPLGPSKEPASFRN